MKRRTVLKIAAVPAILVVGFVGMQALGSTKKESHKRDIKAEARTVETQMLAFGDMALMVEGDGVIQSERELELISEATGRVTFAVNDLKDGTFVRKGQLVMQVDSRDVENDLLALRSEFMNAVASLLPELRLDEGPVYKRWFDYFNSLDIGEPVPDLPEIMKPQEKIQVSAKDIFGKYYAVKNQELKLSKYEIRAPFSGYITSAGVIENTFVSQGQQLFTLSDARNLVVPVPLLVQESQQIDFRSPPRVTIYADDRGGGEYIEGRITRKDTNIDRNSQTLNVYVTFSNDDLNPHFLPGNYVHVGIEGKMLYDVARVPRNLLANEGFVYTMSDGGTLARQRVEVVALQGNTAIVKNTMPDETVIVTTVLQKPLVGMDIRSVNMPELNPEPPLAEAEDDKSTGLADHDEGAGVESVAAGG